MKYKHGYFTSTPNQIKYRNFNYYKTFQKKIGSWKQAICIFGISIYHPINIKFSDVSKAAFPEIGYLVNRSAFNEPFLTELI